MDEDGIDVRPHATKVSRRDSEHIEQTTITDMRRLELELESRKLCNC